MPTLAFVTSLRARALAHDWDYHTRLLDRSLGSFLAQTHVDIAVVVVCNEMPALRTADPRLHFLTVDRPTPARTFQDMTADKVLKVTLGARWATENGCRFLMYADADDLVSRRLAAFVHEQPDANGWYFPEGFAYEYGQRWLTRSSPHHTLHGSCAIVRTELLNFAPDPEYRGEIVESLIAFGHTGYRQMMHQRGHPLKPLPFPGSVYIQHCDSVVTTQPGQPKGSLLRRGLRGLREGARRASKLRPLNSAMLREFTIDRTEV